MMGGEGCQAEGCGEGMSALAEETPRQRPRGKRGQGVLGSRMCSGGQGGAVLVTDEASNEG